jgi:hypothetical protein
MSTTLLGGGAWGRECVDCGQRAWRRLVPILVPPGTQRRAIRHGMVRPTLRILRIWSLVKAGERRGNAILKSCWQEGGGRIRRGSWFGKEGDGRWARTDVIAELVKRDFVTAV